LSEESAELCRSHDICHVIFGLDTTLADEAMVDTRTLLSSDVAVRNSAHCLTVNPEAKALFEEAGYLKYMGITTLAFPRALRATLETWKMPRKWPRTPPPAF
jgi:ubiquinone biosynthesis protein Coq4